MKVNQPYIEWEVLRKILEAHELVFMRECPWAYHSLCDDIFNNVKTPVNNLILFKQDGAPVLIAKEAAVTGSITDEFWEVELCTRPYRD